MSQTYMIFAGLALLIMALMVMPNVFALNRGKNLRNIALWLAIFSGLAVLYKTFGPESAAPLFHVPPSMQHMNRKDAPQLLPSKPKEEEKKEEGTTPPTEQPLSPSI